MMYKQDLLTNCGMWALWDYDAYKQIDDYNKWEPLFCEDEDIARQVEKHTFVPVTIFEDGCRAFTLKVNEPLTPREEKYVCVKSEPYLFHSAGKAVLSGIDDISGTVSPEEALMIDLPAGDYSVRVFLLSWDQEPGAYLADGSISPEALSDFVLLVKPHADAGKSYRTRINTFSEDD